MDRFFAVLEVIAPIFTAVALGMIARKRKSLCPEQVQGMQQFIIKFAIPCVLFNSCIGANFTIESVASMALVPPLLLGATIWSFRMRKGTYPYHNLPMLFCAQESGMLGIPLYMTLFGAAQAFRIGVLDLAQSFVAIPVIAILASNADAATSKLGILREVFRSPLMLMGLLGLLLNVTGCAAAMNAVGIGQILTACTGFMAQPVSAAMLFSVGYNFSLNPEKMRMITKISVCHLILSAILAVSMLGVLHFVPGTAMETRLAVLLYALLPASYLTPTLGRSEDEFIIGSGVCSLLTIVTLALFCAMAVLVR